jgi:hypothetical protein
VHEEPDLTELPEQLRELVTRCMVKEPESRPSVAEILSICQAANGETVLRRPEEWLPSVVAAEITTRKAAPAPPATPAAGQPPVATPAAAAPTHAPTAHAAPQTPPPGFGPAPQTHQQPPAQPQQPAAPQPPAHHQQPPAQQSPVQPTYGYPQAGQPAPGYGYPQTGPYPQQHTGPQPYTTVASPAPGVTPPKKKNKFRNLAIAVLVTLVVGGAAGAGAYLALSDEDDKDKTDQSQGKGEPSTGGTPKQETPSGGAATPGADGEGLDTVPGDTVPAPDPKTYTGLDIVDNYHIFLDHDPIKPIDDDSNEDFEYEGGLSRIDTENARMILLRSGQTGDLDTCRSDTRYTSRIELGLLSKGSQICVLTDSGHVGLVTYQGKSSENDASRFITVDVTVWRNAMDPVPSS